MYETQVTLSGNLGSAVTVRQAGDTPVANFRLGCTPRRQRRGTDEWYDAETQWYSVSAWRGLGLNCAESLTVGDPVVVHGRLSAERWTNADGVEVTGFSVDATFVAHDLNRGTSRFRKSLPRSVDAPPAPEVVVESSAETVAA